ncbi:hypothetical protein BKA66DRAFT_309730 [Pyrenochaeta sp. MPI-SDFR-AT-0127]|nr:hypothetical protein BKA66DRAFT_309730 [Pyrenochaeta sp. MPI-SDFR-AT-0127]
MLESISQISRRWNPSSLKRQRAIDQHWSQDDGSELQILTNKSNKGDCSESIVEEPHSLRDNFIVVSQAPRSRAQKVLGSRFTGWRFGVLSFAISATIVFLLNLIATIWGSTTTNIGKGIILQGDCVRVKRLNTALHVLINILSTILLSGSNYCMQTLSAPTRNEVDKAHDSTPATWLDIGVPGVRNIKYIGRQRKILWFLLGLSSLPLHLLYNSAVFASISSNDYHVYSVSQSFVEDAECLNCTGVMVVTSTSNTSLPETLTSLWKKARAGHLERLSPAECINQYAQIINSNRRNVLLVANDTNFPPPEKNRRFGGSRAYWMNSFSADSAQGTQMAADAYGWICSGPSSKLSAYCSDEVDAIKRAPEDWQVGDYCNRNSVHSCDYSYFPVEYCLSERAEQKCRLHFEPTIAIIITVLNFLKACLMFYVAFKIQEQPLMNMGDAVASFLEKKDLTTKNMCLSTLTDFQKNRGYAAGPRQWNNKQYRWKGVTSRRRRFVILIMLLLALVIVSSLLAWSLVTLPEGFSISRVGYGAIDPRTAIVGMPDDLLTNAVVANSPQLILSILYFSYNGLFTAMLMGYEWNTYAFKRKGLRVSHQAIGAQRSTYFLQLPYRFGTPLMILSGTLHWLVSQSIFLIAIDYYGPFDHTSNAPMSPTPYTQKISKARISGDGYKTLGFSPSAIISVIVLGGVMVIAMVVVGYVPYKRGMTLAGSCSLAISAACHGLETERGGDTIAAEKLQWGVVGKHMEGVGHCAFSAREVGTPVEGEVYS